MASKKAATNEELDDLFAQIGDGDAASSDNPAPNKPPESAEGDDEVFADIKSQLNVPSRTSTPQAPSSAASTKKYTPTSSHSGRSSEEKPQTRTSAEIHARPTSAAAGQKTVQEPTEAASAANSWWGGLSGLSTFATSAVKQAQGAVEQLQKSEDAQKLVEQAKGNYGLLSKIGTRLSRSSV